MTNVGFLPISLRRYFPGQEDPVRASRNPVKGHTEIPPAPVYRGIRKGGERTMEGILLGSGLQESPWDTPPIRKRSADGFTGRNGLYRRRKNPLRRNQGRASVREKKRSTFARRHDPAGRVKGSPGTVPPTFRPRLEKETSPRGDSPAETVKPFTSYCCPPFYSRSQEKRLPAVFPETSRRGNQP